MSLAQITLIVYAVLIAAGGVMGYVKADSKASLIAGIASGVLALLAFVVARFASEPIGYWIGAVVALAVGVRFLMATMKADQFKMMPNGMVIILSTVALIITVMAALKVGKAG